MTLMPSLHHAEAVVGLSVEVGLMKPFNVVVLFASVLLFDVPASAHPGHDHGPGLRVWKQSTGRFEVTASFVQVRDGQVQLCRDDGLLLWVPLDELDTADREWVRERVELVRALNGGDDWQEAATGPVPGVRPDGAAQSPVPLVTAVLLLVYLAAAGRSAARPPVAAGLVLTVLAVLLVTVPEGQAEPKEVSAVQRAFEPFKDKLKFRADDDMFYVESNGMPDHSMMVGIRAWQQQVPLPQAYTGRNAWQIPLHPKLADKPVSAKTAIFRGAIALAVNGVPIFNPLNNRREDAFLAGELDEYGGHCGRGDDYHYHIAPVHLEKVVGKGNPIGYALDGYPLHGYMDAAGKEPKDLDSFNGRLEKDGYRYYSTKAYPYVNGGLRGAVTVKDDQIDPQPRAYSPRPALTPLRGATITGFERDDAKKTITMKYNLRGQTHSVTYTATTDGYTFVHTDGTGKQTTERYKVSPDGRPPPKKEPKKGGPPPKKDSPPSRLPGGFTLTSPAFDAGGTMPAEFTGDGEGISPPLRWTGVPMGTKCFALNLWHKPKPPDDEVKSYWVIASIPASVTGLEKNSKGVGKDGYNDKRRTGYDPMNSKGPGPKQYHITLYALSAEPTFDTDKATRADLLKAVKDITLSETTLSYSYERKAKP